MTYHVQSLDVLSYSKSRLFLSRFRTLRTLEDLVEADAKLHRSKQNTQKSRKEDWLVRAYGDLVQSDHERTQQTAGGTARIARKVHRSEIKNLFARHATWLRAHIRERKLLNVDFWDAFLEESQTRLDEAARSGSSREAAAGS